eukprot:7119513-Ditylum_brightwellii.AAC.1
MSRGIKTFRQCIAITSEILCVWLSNNKRILVGTISSRAVYLRNGALRNKSSTTNSIPHLPIMQNAGW